jgi:hypothetical protein
LPRTCCGLPARWPSTTGGRGGAAFPSGASCIGRGRRIVRVRGAPADLDAFVMGRLCVEVEGINLQAATRIHACARQRSTESLHQSAAGTS